VVRIAALDDAVVGVWSRLREDLLALEGRHPHVLMRYPDPRAAGSHRPYEVRLAAFAEDVAEELHVKYGNHLRITLGALRYPGVADPDDGMPPGWRDPLPLPLADGLGISLDGPLEVRTGYDAGHALLVTNLGRSLVRMSSCWPVIVDPGSGRTVGGSTAARVARLDEFTVEPGQSANVRVLVGTESFDPALGHRVPPGQWLLVALLDVAISHGQRATKVASKPLEFTITG
jgi:hypothetical protein